MKKIFSIAILVWACVVHSVAQQAKPSVPLTFDKFFKDKMNEVKGHFPVYQLDDKYYLQIGAQQLNKDILVAGDIRYGSANISKSSGVLKFTKGPGESLYVTRSNYSEQAIDNAPMANLLSGSTLEPISFTFKIEALGKDTGSYIIDITKQLIDGGELFSFKNYSQIANPDPSRSAVESVVAISNGVAFNVYRSQNNSGRDYNGKAIEQASTFQMGLVLQELSATPMPIQLSDRRIGFETRSFTDFGLAGYAAKKVNIIKKWYLQVKPEDAVKYKNGSLVEPQRPIVVYLHPSIPKFLMNAVKDGVLAWNKCFETAGFKNAIKVILPENSTQQLMEEGTVLIAWGGVANKPAVETVEDPRTGEIKTAKITLSDFVIDDLLQKYFVQVGANDIRIQKDAYSPAVRSDILKFKVSQGMAQVLGMLPNYAGSAAYSVPQVSNPQWVMQHGFTSSITDDLEFNYLMVPTKNFNSKLLIPSIGAYDHFAINWAYRQFQNDQAKPNFLKDGKIDPVYFYAAEDKSNPLSQAKDLSSQNIEAAQKGINGLIAFYPKLDGIAAKMDDDTWDTYMLLAANFIMSYDQYVTSVLPNIGGRQRFTVMKGYNTVPLMYTPKARQQATFDFLYQNVLKGVPAWTRNDRAQFTDGSNTETLVTKTAVKVVNALINADLIKNLLEAENSGQKDVFGTKDLFQNIDRYVFQNFDPKIALTGYQRNVQSTLIRSLQALVAKNKIGAGLSDISVVLNTYTTALNERIGQMAKSHTDVLTREHFQLMKMLMDNEQNAK
ncbi:zinc-dependent metalloprotease [Pedobacter sp. SL55]|uniref:DUF5117 and DUF5118 domain-containing protein n=1 Tax=Pedobacter sp. SL55 TaxID=2995161 RepID=UPI00226F5C8A|nr:zinc-dependent metalloprotease [Pedobacter sp. SL55]WAC41047.1 zinc-dependent metalloprotease [Pedobacter sp. SL55]